VYGTYTLLQPTLQITDAELIRQVLVRDFHVFANRRKLNVYHELINTNLFLTENPGWKRVRAICSCAFTTSKLRQMRSLIHRCTNNLDAHLEKLVASEQPVMITREVMTLFTLDFVSSTSFATETNAYEDTSKNPLLFHALNINNVNPLKVLSYLSMPA